MAFLFKQSSMASFVLTFLKEGSAHDGFIKRLKHRRPVAFLFSKASLASFVLTFLTEGDGQEGFYKRLKHRRPVAFLFSKASLASFVLTFLKERDEKEGGERSECTCPGCPSQSRGLETNDYYSIYQDMPDVGRPVMGLGSL